MDYAKTNARRDEKHLSCGIGRVLYKILDGKHRTPYNTNVFLFDLTCMGYVTIRSKFLEFIYHIIQGCILGPGDASCNSAIKCVGVQRLWNTG